MSTTPFEIILASSPHREHVVAEIWIENAHLAELRHEAGQTWIELYPRKDGQPWNIEQSVLMWALSEAVARLGGAPRTGDHTSIESGGAVEEASPGPTLAVRLVSAILRLRSAEPLLTF